MDFFAVIPLSFFKVSKIVKLVPFMIVFSWWNLCSAFLADIFILDCDYNVCINGYKVSSK